MELRIIPGFKHLLLEKHSHGQFPWQKPTRFAPFVGWEFAGVP